MSTHGHTHSCSAQIISPHKATATVELPGDLKLALTHILKMRAKTILFYSQANTHICIFFLSSVSHTFIQRDFFF